MSRRSIEIGLWVAYVFLATTVNATSVLMEYARSGRPLASWEPFVWEYSSGVFSLLLIPFVLAVESRWPLTLENWRRMLGVHLLATLPYCGLHVAGMVGARKVIYVLMGGTYDFGNVPIELLYEWRKDALSYFFVLFVVNAYRIYRERAEGEANFVDRRQPDPLEAVPHFRVTYNRRDFNLDPREVEWIESAGNYVVLHVAEKTYLMRETMKNLEDRLAQTSFVRVHRSRMVNLAHVKSSATQQSKTLLHLTHGATVEVSRSYRPAVLSALSGSSLHPSTSN